MGHEPIQMVRFGKLSVNLIESNSGIFIGNINANGWHSNNKNNSGFGSISGSSLDHSINLVIDNDGIDTVINDYNFSNDNRASRDSKSNQFIHFDSINVNSQSIASGINTGENDLRNWRSHSKINKGFGNAAGVNKYSGVINENIDNDIMDTQIDDTSLANFNSGQLLEVGAASPDDAAMQTTENTESALPEQKNNENKQPEDPTA